MPEDEYDSYIPQIYRMIRDRESIDQLSLALSEFESGHIGLQADQQRNRCVAQQLLELALSDKKSE